MRTEIAQALAASICCAALAAAALTGCANSISRPLEPTLIVHSKRPAKDVSACIAKKWEALLTETVMNETPTGWSVAWVNKGIGRVEVHAVIDSMSSTTSQTTVFRKNVDLPVDGHFQAVKDCQRL